LFKTCQKVKTTKISSDLIPSSTTAAFDPKLPPALQVSQLSHLPSHKVQRLQRYFEYANPPRRRPQPLLFVTTVAVAVLFIGIGLLPKYMLATEFYDDPQMSDKSDKIVEGEFDSERKKWIRVARNGIKIPESLTWR
jgi:hypothetical protein